MPELSTEEYEELIQARRSEDFKDYLFELMKKTSESAMLLRMSYLQGEVNLEAHNCFISYACELWLHLFPKMHGSHLEKEFNRLLPFYIEPKFFLRKGFEHMIWYTEYVLRMGFEHLNLASID